MDPRSDTLALLRGPAAAPVLLVGPLAGPLVPRTPLGPVVSPSWGSGEHGLWLLRTGGSPALLVAPPQGAVREVAATLPRLGTSPLLRVSRDGVRVALVADGWLYVGRLETDDGGRPVRLVALRALRDGVLDASWQTGTSLAVLVRDEDPPLLPLLRLSVDGTSAVESGLLGVGVGDPVALAAFRDQPLLVETTLRRTSTTYGEDGNLGFQVVRSPSRRPFYPG